MSLNIFSHRTGRDLLRRQRVNGWLEAWRALYLTAGYKVEYSRIYRYYYIDKDNHSDALYVAVICGVFSRASFILSLLRHRIRSARSCTCAASSNHNVSAFDAIASIATYAIKRLNKLNAKTK